MASDDVLLVADDGLRVIHQVSLERDGVTIRGKSMKTLSNYPTHIEKCGIHDNLEIKRILCRIKERQMSKVYILLQVQCKVMFIQTLAV